jgi:KUP system potassium uptake protein
MISSRCLEKSKPACAPRGTAVFLTSDRGAAPTALLHNLKHNKVLHEAQRHPQRQRTAQVPLRAGREERRDRSRISPRTSNRIIVELRLHGNAQRARAVLALAKACEGLIVRHHAHLVLPQPPHPARPMAKWGMPLWQDHLFIFLSRNATNATEFFRIPTSRVVELGSQMTI